MLINKYIVGNVESADVWDKIPDGSIQCVVTSPPYWGLRDYGTAKWDGGDFECDHKAEPKRTHAGFNERYFGKEYDKNKQGELCEPMGFVCKKCGALRIDDQLGLEATPEAHIAKMVEVFREFRRVLRKDGTVWLNYGDSYVNHSTPGGGDPTRKGGRNVGDYKYTPTVVPGLKPKDLCMIPARVAIALQADGWWLRSDIIWAKPNPMPESCTDRPTSSYEHIFLLTKSAKYFYDQEAVREKGTQHPSDWIDGKPKRESALPGEFGGKTKSVNGIAKAFRKISADRNLRNVWTIPTQPMPEAHFATFPEALVKRCVLAGTSHKACEICGAPWERVVEKEELDDQRYSDKGGRRIAEVNNLSESSCFRTGKWKVNSTTGFRPTCKCEQKGTGKCVILDPFMGSGTVAKVAQELGRDWIGIDLGGPDGEYEKIAKKRLQGATIGLNL